MSPAPAGVNRARIRGRASNARWGECLGLARGRGDGHVPYEWPRLMADGLAALDRARREAVDVVIAS